eukprot:9761-Heterococcus_DN1.PRE.3
MASHKRVVAEAMHPLSDAGTLRHILEFLVGDWLFLDPVSKLFNEVYLRLDSFKVTPMGLNYCQGHSSIKCDAKTTLAAAVFASPARLQTAVESGLDLIDNGWLNLTAGHCADIDTLEAAKTRGLTLDEELMKGLTDHVSYWAARSGSINLLRWLQQHHGVTSDVVTMRCAGERGHPHVCEFLLEQQCPYDATVCEFAAANGHADTLRWLCEHNFPWSEESMRRAAALGGCVDILQYLLEHGIQWNANELTDTLSLAACRNKLAAVQWLRQQGAEWPAILQYEHMFLEHVFSRESWHPDIVAWARQQGCTSPELQH